MSDPPTRHARYPLRAVIRRTGLSADVIRAWERRYSAVAPERSQGGQRLYSERDVVRLSLLARATSEGLSIGEIARLDVPALEALLHAPQTRGGAERAESVSEVVATALGATERLDPTALETILKRAILTLGVDRFVDEIVGRFLTEVGIRWHRGAISPAHEHLASDTLRRVLAWIAEAYELAPDAPTIVVATPAGELHELGAMTIAAAAHAEGWRVIYLGANLPARDIASAAQQVGARVVALSLVYANGDEKGAADEVGETARAVPDGVDVVVGGAAAQGLAASQNGATVRVLSDVDSFRRMLRGVWATRTDIRTQGGE
jgi:DNA-binding transcriptional MerR regulator/methylmalonyl-CoA mutase cobalamin-binding subunit